MLMLVEVKEVEGRLWWLVVVDGGMVVVVMFVVGW